MTQLVQRLLDLHKLNPTPPPLTPNHKTALQNQITATDRRIDKIVYDLYNLTKDEIRIIEETTP